MSHLTKLLLIIFGAVLIVILYGIVRSYFLFQKTLALEAKITPFSRNVPHPAFRILVLGDSTAVGTGVQNVQDSTAGRLGALYPDAEVVNLAVNGLRIQGLQDILKTRDESEHFDIVLIQIGANDIIRFTSFENIETRINAILERSAQFGGKVIVLHSGNVGDSKFFPLYVRSILSSRSLKVRSIYQKAASAHGASYVDIIGSPISETFKKDPYRYYADDLLHLSGEGYGLWFEEIQKNLK